MPHNPRRDRDRSRSTFTLSEERITDAVTRAVALKRETAICPEAVTGQPMTVADVQSIGRRIRRQSLWDWAEGRKPSPWWWIGWVHFTPGDIFTRQTWEVWLDVEDDRVWLRYRRPPD